jgi:hypothetical protein
MKEDHWSKDRGHGRQDGGEVWEEGVKRRDVQLRQKGQASTVVDVSRPNVKRRRSERQRRCRRRCRRSGNTELGSARRVTKSELLQR